MQKSQLFLSKKGCLPLDTRSFLNFFIFSLGAGLVLPCLILSLQISGSVFIIPPHYHLAFLRSVICPPWGEGFVFFGVQCLLTFGSKVCPCRGTWPVFFLELCHSFLRNSECIHWEQSMSSLEVRIYSLGSNIL